MSRTRRRLLALHPEAAAAIRRGMPEDEQSEIEVEIASRRNLVQALRSFDRRARLHEELIIRLVGEVAHRGALDLELTSFLVGIRRSFVDAAGVELALAEISAGSTVLHFRPTQDLVPEAFEGEDALQVDSSAADAVGRAFVRLVEAAESEGDVARWVTMVRGLEEAVSALDHHELDAEMAWLSPGGPVELAKLTSRGRAYVRRLSEPKRDTRVRVVSGRVTELREVGIVKLRRGTSRTSPVTKVHVNRDTLVELRLQLGQTAYFIVQEMVDRDRLGREREARYEFIRVVGTQEASDLGIEVDEPGRPRRSK